MIENLTDKRIALIGGAGFIGHNLALALKKRGAYVGVIDGLEVNNLLAFSSTGNEIPNRNLYLRIIQDRLDLLRRADIPLYVQDARDYGALNHLINKIQPNVIVHLAAVAHADRSNKNPYSTFDHSLRTLENALDNSKNQNNTRNRVNHFIYFSSSMVYGNFSNGFVTEDTVCYPLGIYGALKYAGEKLVIGYHQVFDLPYTIIRPSALYGPGCVSRRVGQIFIENALQDLEIIVSGDGSDQLDFTYIDDLIQGIIKVIENKNSRNQIFNLTHGQSRSIKEMISIIKEHFPRAKISHAERDKLMPSRGTLSVDKAKKLLNYQPEYPLEKGFVEYIQWYRKLFNENNLLGKRE